MMPARAATLLLLAAAASATAQGCGNAQSCGYNGACVSTACECFPGWTGPLCGQLDLLPAPAPPRNGYNVANTSSWGGGVLFDSATQLYHMYVAKFINHCGLLTWHNNSRVVRATAAAATGPYTFAEEAVPVYSHNPSVARTRDGAGVILMHIGGGTNNGVQHVCVNGSSQSGNVSAASPVGATGTAGADAAAAGSVGTLCADALGGLLRPCPGAPFPGFTNPTLWAAADGSLLVGGNANYSLALSRGANCSNFGCAAWSPQAHATPNRTGEDPWIWQRAADGVWHALFHDMSPDLPAGRHAYSADDGVHWTLTDEIAYTGTVQFDDGSALTYSKRERPHLLLSAAGDPVALFTGVMQFPEHVDDHSWTLAQAVRGAGR